MKLTDFEALTFDCYGTLIDWETGILAVLEPWTQRQDLAVGRDRLLEAFGRHESAAQAAEPSRLYPEILAKVLHELAAEFGIEATNDEAKAFGASVKDWPAFPDSTAALTYLKQYYRLVITSNIDRASFKHSNDKLGVVFDLIITAEDVGSYKPAPAHFERAIETLAPMGIPRAKILHTAQSLFHDHEPAKRHGLASIWINRHAGREGGQATRAPNRAVTPDWQVPSMAAMVTLHKEHVGAG